ncbi:hypothetical protein OF83DRAFT_1161740 [Amylostereum chailletii]|nr:hypothetical protein OF83DRAFT_1161740 [Amylostereum chailletii]
MPLNFTFNFAVAGVPNPFSTSSDSRRAQNGPPAGDKLPTVAPAQRRPHPATLPPSLPLNRKRGWVPPNSEPSQAATSRMSSSGYLDTPAKYRDFTVTPHAQEEEEENAVEEMVAELPPAKRRRGLAGSIVSTAVSAALIGTAVGLTVYRLWRDRGKEPENPPPPYEQGDWIHRNSSSKPQAGVPPVHVVPPTPRYKKPRQVAVTNRRTPARPRRARPQLQVNCTSHSERFPRQTPCPARIQFRPCSQMDDPIDWMGGRLAQLIEEGKRALGKEVVVMSETQEDEVDDGSGAWEEEDPLPSTGSTSRRGSIRRKHRPQHLGIPGSFTSSNTPLSASASTSFLSSPSLSPHYPGSDSLSSPVYGSMQIPGRGLSEERGLSGSFREDSSQWQSAELRESMEKARARYLQARS